VIRAGETHVLTGEDLEAVFRTNLLGAFHACQLVLPNMRARGAGDIVNVASVAAESDFPTMAAYAASKAGLLALSGAIRAESRTHGVRVLDVVAGATDTEMWASFWPDAPRERMMSADSVAHAVLAALTLPRDATMERVVLRPIGGDL